MLTLALLVWEVWIFLHCFLHSSHYKRRARDDFPVTVAEPEPQISSVVLMFCIAYMKEDQKIVQ